MPLTAQAYTAAFLPFFDPESALFQAFPETHEAAAQKWAAAVAKYAATVVPASTTLKLAETAFYNQFLKLPTSTDWEGVIREAFAAFARALATGMAGFVAMAPPIPLDLRRVYDFGLAGESSRVCLEVKARIVDAWFKTGTAKNVATGITVKWL